jgi:hypothetical protein
MTGWHADETTLRRWIDQSDSLPEGASVEQHLLSCAPCRARVSTLVSPGLAASPLASPVASPVDLAEVWARTRDSIELPRLSPFEWLLQRVGLPANDARLVATASAFRGRWLAGIAAVLAFAATTAALGQSRGMWAFLAIAPLIPCVAVAISYDPRIDPALQPEVVTPYPVLRLVLLRSVAILAVALPAVALAGLLVPGWAPTTWLLPAFGFAAVVLALSTWMSPLRAAIGVSLAWLAIVWLLVARAGTPDAVLQARFQGGYVILAIASITIFFVRARHLRELRPRRNWS